MSQSITFYRLSAESFKQLELAENKHDQDISSIAKSYACAQGTFIAIEYILAKGQDRSVKELVNELFNPTRSLGGENFDELTTDEQMAFYENGGFIYYLDPETVYRIDQLFDMFSGSDLQGKYNSAELNSNGIYPKVWHDDNSPGQAYNQRHFLDDAMLIKNFFKEAEEDKDYVLVFSG